MKKSQNLKKFRKCVQKTFKIFLLIFGNIQKNSAVCVSSRTVNVNTFSTTVKDEILEGRQIPVQRGRGVTIPIILCVVVSRSVSRSYVTRLFEVDTDFKNIFTFKKKKSKIQRFYAVYVSVENRFSSAPSVKEHLFCQVLLGLASLGLARLVVYKIPNSC